jgi:hypothetical protein
MIETRSAHSFTNTTIPASASRNQKVQLQFLPKNLEIGVKLSNRTGILLHSIDHLLQFRDTNQISLRKAFAKFIPNVDRILEENNRLRNGFRNGVKNPRRNELIASIPRTVRRIKCVGGNEKSTVDEIKLHLRAKSSFHGA